MKKTFNFNDLESGAVSPQEEKEATFESAVKQVRSNGYELHERLHDPGGEDPKVYHVSEHPRTVEKRALRMADVLHLSREQRLIAEMAIAWHDTAIEYDKADPNDLLAMIRRHRGAREGDKPSGFRGNEAESGRRLEEKMRKANELAGREVFTEEQIRTGVFGVEATYVDVNLGPDFKGAAFEEYPYYEIALRQNPALGGLLGELRDRGITKGPLFFQPHLEKPLEDGKAVPREVLLVALGDLGAAGLADREEFFKEGDAEMRELYANLRRPEVMRRLKEGDEETDRSDREKVIEKFTSWLDSQPGFAAWQGLRFEKIIHLLKQQNGLSLEEEDGMRRQFSHYADNISAARDRASNLKKETEEIKNTKGEKEAFLFLARSMHYE